MRSDSLGESSSRGQVRPGTLIEFIKRHSFFFRRSSRTCTAPTVALLHRDRLPQTEVAGVCREQSIPKLDEFKDHITVIPGRTDDREVIKTAVAGCEGVLVVLAPWGTRRFLRQGRRRPSSITQSRELG